MTLKHAYGDIDLALLQAELCQRRNRSFTFWIRAQCLIATPLRRFDVLLPLKQGQTLVYQWKHVRRFPAEHNRYRYCVIIKRSKLTLTVPALSLDQNVRLPPGIFAGPKVAHRCSMTSIGALMSDELN